MTELDYLKLLAAEAHGQLGAVLGRIGHVRRNGRHVRVLVVRDQVLDVVELEQGRWMT